MQVRNILNCLCGILLCASTSFAGALPTTPSGSVVVDGTSYPVLFEIDDESGLWNASFSIDVPGQYEVNFSGIIDPDPSISYGFAVIDYGTPSTFGLSISSPIVSTASPTEVIASIAGGLIDVTGNGFSLTPTLADADGDSIAEVQVASVGSPLQNMGVDVGAGVSYGSGTPGAIPGGYGSYSEPVQAGPNSGPYTSMQLDLGFTLSGLGDIAALTGHAEIAVDGGIVPEPSTFALGALGLVSLGFSAWRRNRQCQA